MKSCKVKSNCKTPKTDCWFCEGYGLYKPANKSILSPKQEENKLKKKLKKKAKKISTASKRGKANRRNGRNAERQVAKYLEGLGLDVTLVPCSGALKNVGMLSILEQEVGDKFSGDIKLIINNKTYTIECKRNINSDSWYKKANAGMYHIEGFAYLLKQELFERLILGMDVQVEYTDEDKGYKMVHKYFDQDNSDLVVITRPYMDKLFFVKENFLKTLKGCIKEEETCKEE